MTSVQRVPVIEEILLSDSDDEVHNLHNDDARVGKSVRENANENSAKITSKFPSQNIKFTIEQVYLQGDFEIFDVPDSSDEQEAIKNSNVNLTSNKGKQKDFMDQDGAETDEDQFYIDEDARDANTASDEPIDLSLTREDERLSSISSSAMSLSSKSGDDDKLSTGSSTGDIVKYSTPETIVKTDNVFMETENASSDDEAESADAEVQEISMPSRDDKQFRVRGKTHIETICETCHIERRMAGKVWQNKFCRNCKENLQFQCANCKKRFTSYHSTLCHLKKECLSQKFWSCPQCVYSVLEEKKLEDHIKRVHVDGGKARKKRLDGSKPEPRFFCELCHAGFRWKGNLLKHNCSKREIVSYRCEVCDYTNASKTMVKRHFTNCHIKGRWLVLDDSKKCSKFISTVDARPICVPDITSSSNETKRKTEEEIRADEERLNKSIALHCPKCSRDFQYSGTHIKKCETCDNALLWQCSACKEQSKSYCGIYAHLQSSCTAILQSCKRCGKTFELSDDLEKHRHVCGQDLYLQCELCDYKTRQKGFFLKHVKVKHDLQDDEIRKWL